MSDKSVFKLINKFQKESKTAEHYNTGLVGEQLIVSAYQSMTVDKLEKLRYIMNKIITKKKNLKKANDSNNMVSNNSD